MRFYIFYFILFISCFLYAEKAQSQLNPALAIDARGYADRIVLRYAPSTPILFNEANRNGYHIERADYVKGIPNDKLIYKPINGSPFKRLPNKEWEKAILFERTKDTVSANLATLAMAYSDPDAIAGGDVLKEGLKSLKDQKSNADMKFGYSLIAANRSIIAAEALGVRAIDTDVKTGKTYVYKVSINQTNSAAYINVTSGSFNANSLRNDKLVKLTELDKSVSFSFPENRAYYSFYVERSDDGGNSYHRITKTPELNLKPIGFKGKLDFAYGDSALVNYKKYYYRIMVATYYADELLLAQFVATPRDKTPPPAPFLKTAIHIKPTQVELKWEIKQNGNEDLKGFSVKRGTKRDGTFTLISKTMLSKTTTGYIDETFNQYGSNYYIVEAIDTAGNNSSSFPAYVTLIDSIPPAIPIISSAKIDSLGKIIIKIKPNAEKDFMGYQLQKANAKEHEFSVVEETFKDSLGATTFTIKDSTTLNTLTKKIYYKVIAFDTHFNQSAPSAIIELKKRDTIPPVSPLIKDFMINDTSVVIVFANSSSEDAVLNYVLRRETGKVKFDTVFVNKNTSVIKFTDVKIIGGKQYEYAMIAKDDGGLNSKISRSIQLKTLLNNRIPTPEVFGSYNQNNKKIDLSFKVDEKLKNRKLTIELFKRSDQKSAWKIYKTIPYIKDQHMLENSTTNQNSYFYMIRLVDEKKNSSNFSNELAIKL
ncbi:MAG: hypothetical protein H7202_06420 [Pedobacter sp.]|nr:hypothetical protein [Pedobacter sp.]